MTPSAPPSTLFSLLGRAFFRHKWKMALCFFLCLTAVVAGTLLSPRSYRSQAKLLVRLGRENATLDPTATLGQNSVVAVPATRENDLNSFLEILTSRSILEQVVDKLGIAVVRGKKAPSADESEQNEPATPEDRAEAIQYLARKLDVEVVKRSNILTITYQAPRADAAQAVVATLIDVYLDQHVRMFRTPGAYRFLSEQVGRVQKQLAATEEDLRQLKDKTGLVSPEAQRQLLVTRVGRLEDELLQTETSLAAAEAEVSELTKRVEDLPATHVTAQTKGMPNQGLDTLRSQLYTLQLKELELSGRYPESHPEVRSIRKQVQTARALLEKEGPPREQITEGPNRLYEEAQLSLLRQGPLIRALRTRAELLRAQIKEQKQALTDLNHNDLQLGRLQRRLELEITQHRKYAESLEQLQIDQALQAERISNVNVVQPATLEPIPVKPRLTTNLALGLVFALGSSLSLAVLLESTNRTLKTPQQLKQAVSARLLASIPLVQGKGALSAPEVLAGCQRAWSEITWGAGSVSDGQPRGRVIGLIGVGPGVGTTTISVGLARVIIDAVNEPVLLMNGGSPGSIWLLDKEGSAQGPGLSEVLQGQAELDAAIRPATIGGLYLLPAGRAEGAHLWTTHAGQLIALLEQLRSAFAWILVDLPSETSAPFRQALAAGLDGLILVAGEEQSTAQAARERLQEWTAQGIRDLGVILNRHRALPSWLEQLTQESV